MPATPYFHSEALRQRFQRNLRTAQAEGRISAEEFRYLHHLGDTEQSVIEPQQSVELYRVLLEDGSPEPLDMVSALIIDRWTGDLQTVYLDTLADGLKRFANHTQLNAYLKTRFSVDTAQVPAFQVRLLEGPMFEQRMWQVIDHQAQTLEWLAAELQKLPSLEPVLRRLLAPTLSHLWPDGDLDLQAPLVQIVDHSGNRHGANREHPVRLQTFAQLAMDILLGKVLPPGQRRRFTGLNGQPLDALGTSDFDLRMADLEDEYEHLLGDFWNTTDSHGLTRRERFAQALADGFSHQVWMLQQSATAAIKPLERLAAAPLYEISTVPVSRLTLNVDARGPYKLVSLYLIQLEQGAFALYSPLKGLRLLKNRRALNDLVDSPAGRSELHRYLSLNDQSELPALDAGVSLHVKDYPVDKPLFYDCIDAIIGLQERSLAAGFKHRCRDEGELHAMLDDTLDIRTLIDARLPWIGAAGRWLSEATQFTASWPSTPAPKPAPNPAAVPGPSWGEQLSRIENLLSDISDQRPTLDVLARQAVSPYLAALGYPRPHEGERIRVTWRESGSCDQLDEPEQMPCEGLSSHGLTDLVLERISGARITAIPPHSKVVLPAEHYGAQGLGPITAELIEHIAGKVAPALLAACTPRTEAFYEQPLRIARTQQRVSRTLLAVREQLLRLELTVARRKHDIAPSLLDLLQSVLDRPMSEMRRALVEVHTLGIGIGGKRFALGLNVAWALQLPDQPAHNLLFWSPFIGLKMLNSRKELQRWLQERLADPEWRSRWLDVFPGADRQWVDERLAAGGQVSITLERADGDFLRRMQHDAQCRVGSGFAAALQDARQHRLAAEPFRNDMALAGNDDWLLTWFDAAAIRVQNLLFTSTMPDWVTMASLEDLELYVQLVHTWFRNNDPADDFLADVPVLQRFARQQLLEALQRDFPGAELDPDAVTVVSSGYVLAPVHPGEVPVSVPGATLVNSESLLDFSLNHFSQIGQGELSVHLPAGTQVPAGLNGAYVARLAHDLDIGLRYQELLAERLDPQKAEYAERRERFMRQIPSRLLVTAMEMKLQGIISQIAFDYLEQVLTMPDGTARQPVNGRQVVLRPLTLVPRADMEPDPVEGFFLIGPKDPTQGPVVLHIHFSEQFSLKEFRDHEHLLAELRVEGPLQALLLSRLEPQIRSRYDHGGLIEAHLPFSTEGILDTLPVSPGDVRLGTQIVEGNALRYLFEAIVQLMHSFSRTQAVTSAQADWKEFVHVMELLAGQVLMFAPGKLGLLVSLWDVRNLMGHSVSAAAEQHWGQALGEFTAAMGMLITTRRAEVESVRTRNRPRPSIFSWRNSSLSAELRLRLSEFEVLGIELSSLHYDALYNLYKDPLTQTLYAAVEGKVYRVHQFEGVWRIKGEAGEGPSLRRDNEQKWQLDLGLGLRGGSPSPNSKDQALESVVDKYMIVRAEGMKNIRLYSREEARKINMARFDALGYLKNALFNLNAPTAEGLSRPVQDVLREFFGVEQATPQIIDSLRRRFTELFVGLSEPSLMPLSSSRFILGTSKSGYEAVAAFVVVGDARRRIFLNDLFFSPPDYALKDVLPGNRAFSAEAHFRASTLIHEMSHQACETVDFAYLDASAPPPEMIDDTQSVWSYYKEQLLILRERALSHQTPKAQLFRVPGLNGGRDLQPRDGRLFSKMIRLTRQPTLERARQAFLYDPAVRSRVILANADSVAMLANLLGRERFA